MMARRAPLMFLLFMLILTTTPAHAEELYDFQHLLLRLQLSNDVTLIPEAASWNVENVTAALSWFPRESYRQHVRDIRTSPEASLQNGVYHYSWSRPRQNTLHFTHTSLVETSNDPLPVTKKVAFPISSLPSALAQYTKPAKIIDSNEEIRQQAFRLAAGKDDLFEVVFTVATWVTSHITYDLQSIAATARKPSSWVFDHREGVCDEMTSLFISMVRSLGIPARFVSGVSYTNLPEFAEPWGGHGWAEVWFPGTGWVPFDVTYGTYGFIDATHIKLQDAVDAGGESVEFTMLGRNVNLATKSLDIDVKVLGKRRGEQDVLKVTLAPFKERVGLESFNLIIATVKNNKPFYVSTRLQLAQTENLVLLGSAERNVLLKPYATKKLYFLVHTQDLENGFQYQFPVKLYAGLREVASTSFIARQDAPSFEKRFFNDYLTAAKEGLQGQASLSCTAPPVVRVGEKVTVTCSLASNRSLSTVRACLGKECSLLKVKPGESTFHASFTCATPGVKSVLATAKSSRASAFALATYECADEAQLAITNLSFPSSLAFNEQGEINFSLVRKSETLPEEVNVTLIHDNFAQWWFLDRLAQAQRFSFSVQGRDLDLSGNTVTLRVSFTDRFERHTVERSFVIAPRDLTLGEKLLMLLTSLNQWVERLFV